MSTPSHPRKKEQSNTYVMHDRQGTEDQNRLALQSRLLTASMGGPLSEHPNPGQVRRALDVGSGSGGWVIETAQAYPLISLVGIDINPSLVNYANGQAKLAHVDDRVEFLVMDALRPLVFPDASFDLVNLRLGLSFLRTWDWPALLSEMIRITQVGGHLQLTDTEIVHQGTSPAMETLTGLSLCAFFRAGHLFTNESSGLTSHLARLLTQYGCQQVQSKISLLDYKAGTPNGQLFFEDMKQVFLLVRPFLQKWGCYPKDYEEIYQQALIEMQEPDFHATWHLLSAWGVNASVRQGAFTPFNDR